MQKYDVSKLNNLISDTGKLIDNDPLNELGDEVNTIKENFEDIHRAISDEGVDEKERKGLLSKVIGKLIGSDEGFQYKTFEGKISSIFRQFDTTFNSVENSIEMYEKYGNGLEEEISSLSSFLEGIDKPSLSADERGVLANYEAMKNTLVTSLGRIKMSRDSAMKLHNTMETGRPIFQALLSSCMIEVSGQRSIDASAQMIGTITGTIEKLSTTLTESTIKTSQNALTISTKPVLSNEHLKQNMLLLEGAFNSMQEQQEEYAKKLLSETTQGEKEGVIVI